MTDVSTRPVGTAWPAATNLARAIRPSRALGWRAVLVLSAALAVAAAFWISAPAASAAAVTQAGPQLTLLLRFMAIVKGATALALLALCAWRLGYPIRVRFALAYVVATVLMACAPVLIWQMVHVGAGALLFHVGWIALLVSALADREGRVQMREHGPAQLARLVARRR